MKNFQTTAVVALMTAAIGLSAIAPSYAQDAAAPTAAAGQQMPAAGRDPMGHMGNHDGQGQGRQGLAAQHRGGARGMAGLMGFERGSEAVEIALVRLSHAIDMTAEQQALFDTLKTDALAAADTFATTVEGLRPTPPAQGQTAQRPDITKGLETRIALETAHVEALKAVQPSLTAFFNSLTEEQTAELMPAPGQRGNMQDHNGSMGQRGQHDRRDHDDQRQNGHRQGGDHDGQGEGPMGGMNGQVGADPIVPPAQG
ncbi:MAG: Spy/CpxP family protein refolding chaperone [Devosia sp.]